MMKDASRGARERRDGRFGRVMKALWAYGLLVIALTSCGMRSSALWPVVFEVGGVQVQGLSAMSGPVPRIEVVVYDCSGSASCDAGTDELAALSFGPEGRPGEECAAADVASCALLFTPEEPSRTLWLPDGSFLLTANAFVEAEDGSGAPSYCASVPFGVGPGEANLVEIHLSTCDDGVGFTAIAAGELHSLALDADGNAWAWGYDGNGQLGDAGTSSSQDAPVAVDMPDGVSFTAIAAGSGHSLALDTNGNAWAWGYDVFGQLGDGGRNSNQDAPVAVAMPDGVSFTTVAAGGLHSLALDADGNAWAWGYDGYGQLGDGGTSSSQDAPVAVAMPDGVSFTAIAAGFYHSLALDTNGNAWAWGYDGYGQLGDGGSNSNQFAPVAVTSGSTP